MRIFRIFPLALAVLLSPHPAAVELSRGESGSIARLVMGILSTNHLRKDRVFNNQLSATALDLYLDHLDGGRRIFLQKDIDEFRKKYATKLDDHIYHGDARPGYDVYERYLQRLEERVKKVPSWLQLEVDFTLDESLELDRSERPWPATEEEADELWRKRIKANLLQEMLDEERDESVDIKEKLAKRYNRMLDSFKDLDPAERLELFLTAVGNAYDPHTYYMGPSESEDFHINIKLELSGIGARLQSDEDGYCKIVDLIPGGPAMLSKQIHKDDLIVAVAQADGKPEDVIGMRLRKVVDLIRGKKGTEVRLTVRSAGKAGSETKVVPLIRDVIKLEEQQAKAKLCVIEDEDKRPYRLGIIQMMQFYENSTEDVRDILRRLKEEKVDGVILDLRYNGGGILDEAVALTGLFFHAGPVVQVKNSLNHIYPLEDTDRICEYDGPLIVLVSRHSASASEITAAALQDYGRAVVVGERATHGKGTVQTLENLDRIMRQYPSGIRPKSSGTLKYTISKFYRIKGTTTQKIGVSPDIVLPSVDNYRDDIGEDHLLHSLEADQIAPIESREWNMRTSYVEKLTQQAQERIKNDTDFAYIDEDIQRYLEIKERRTLSLNYDRRSSEIDELKKRREARKQERAQREPPARSVYLVNYDDEKEPLVKLPYLTADQVDAEQEEPSERIYDPHLQETLNILSDYIAALP